jgi:phosphoribosylformimino-5-aminoimidazole carboxamide ribotide isomerase
VDLFPAIDLRGGRCVRLLRGDYDAETVYGDDPVAQAESLVRAGSRWVHMVDLDAARSGEPDAANREAIEAVCASVARRARVQVGGGVRSEAAAGRLLDVGVSRVVVGTAAVTDPDLVDALVARFGGHRIAVGLDARGRAVAVRGWTADSGADLVDLAQRFGAAGVAALIVTEIGRDGTMAGPDVDQLADVMAACSLDVVASGGVGTVDDLRTLAGMAVDGRGLAGAIVGRALYERRFTVEEALAACSPSV